MVDHTSRSTRDGVWLFVENAYSAGWIEARDAALADQRFVDSWMKRPLLVIVRDYTLVADAKRGTVHRAKIGTILPMSAEGDGGWEALVASTTGKRRAVGSVARLPRETAVHFPLAFNRENVALIGNQVLGALIECTSPQTLHVASQQITCVPPDPPFQRTEVVKLTGYGPSIFRNRLVRTRMPGGVEAGGEKPPAIRLEMPAPDS